MVKVFLLIIAFWVPGEKTPTVIQHEVLENEELCFNSAHLLTQEWMSSGNGRTTSFACLMAFPGTSS